MAHIKETGKNVNGVLILDKPIGISSNQALQRVKKILDVKKAGHTGALDVLASGLLPICLGEATKFSQFLLDADKYYRTTTCLGKRTITCDSEGEVIEEKSISDITDQKIEAVLQQFRGEIEQIPSMFSALKHKGTPLYKLARKGIEVERKSRKLIIYELKKIKWTGCELMLEVRCSKGTYIRNLVDDIGKALGCGAYVLSLRRLEAGPYKSDQMITLEQLEKIVDSVGQNIKLPIQKIESMFPQISKIILNPKQKQSLYFGQKVKIGANFAATQNEGQTESEGFFSGQLVQLFDSLNQFFGIGQLTSDGMLRSQRLLKIE